MLKGPLAADSELPVPGCDVSQDSDFRAQVHLGMVCQCGLGILAGRMEAWPPALSFMSGSGLAMGSDQLHLLSKHERAFQRCSGCSERSLTNFLQPREFFRVE